MTTAQRLAGCILGALLAAGCAASEDGREGDRAEGVSIPNASLYGIHFFPGLRDAGGHFVVDDRPAWTSGNGGPRMWDVELVSGEGYRWFNWEGQCLPNTTCGAYRALAARNIDIISRFDYYVGGNTVPTDDGGIAEWKRRLSHVFDNSRGGSIVGTSRVYIVGNEPNICVEAGGAPGCAPASSWIDAGRYAAAYRAMRPEIRRLAQAAGNGDVAVLLAGPSGAGYHGLGYLREQLEHLCGDTVDGVALHSYGGLDDDPDRDGTYGFSRDLVAQIQILDAACGGRFRSVPIFVTEFSRGNRPHPDSDFVYNVYSWLHRWNAAGNHNVVAATYFLGRGTDFAHENITLDSPNNHSQARAAFGRAVAQRWAAGSWGAPGGGGGGGGGGGSETMSCGAWAARNGFSNPACEWNGNGACGGRGARTSDCSHCCDLGATPPPPSSCGCRSDVDNFCQYGRTDGCAMTQPGGYCDPNGDGDFSDADWVRGWTEYRDRCGSTPPPPPPPPPSGCPCRAGVDNFCAYGPRTDGCAMTQPGGYCDPDGDGSYADADWVRGYNEYASRCR